MTEFTLQPFGQIDSDALEEDYFSEVEITGKTISLDINFAKTNTDLQTLSTIKDFIEKIQHYDAQNLNFIHKEFHNTDDPIVKDYVTFHTEDLGDEFLEKLGIDPAALDKEQQFLKQIYLKRVGIYPDGKYNTTYFAVFDYTVNPELTDELLVVKTDDQGDIDHMTMES